MAANGLASLNRLGELEGAGYRQWVIQLVPGQEQAIEDWARLLMPNWPARSFSVQSQRILLSLSTRVSVKRQKSKIDACIPAGSS